MFTDIVGSSEVASDLGDERWHRLQARHHDVVRKQLKRYEGHEVDTAGDGFFITFSSPARGVRCAFAVVREIRELGLDVRAGLHIGEAQLTGEKVGGIAVTTAARVAAAAGPGQVLATDTIVHLVAGSGFEFTDLGSRELKGVQGRWELFSLDAVDGESIGPPADPQQAEEYRRRTSAVEHPAARRKLASAGVLALTILLTAAAIVIINQRHSRGAPQLPLESPAVQGTLAILNADTGAVVDRPPGVASSQVTGAVGTSGPILLTEPAGRGHQAFAWIFSGTFGFNQRLQKLDQASGAILNTSEPLRSCQPPGCLAVANGKVWFLVPSNASSIAHNTVAAEGIYLASGESAAPVRVGKDISISGVHGMTAGDGALWIGDTNNSAVWRFDPATGRRARPYAIRGAVDDVAFGGGYVWVIDTAGATLTRVDPRNGHWKRRSLNSAGTLTSVATGGGYVWITDETGGVVWRVSNSLGPVTRIPVGSRPVDVTYADGNVWVANYGDGSVSKIDATLAQQAERYPVGIQPRALAVASGKVWVVGNIIGVSTA